MSTKPKTYKGTTYTSALREAVEAPSHVLEDVVLKLSDPASSMRVITRRGRVHQVARVWPFLRRGGRTFMHFETTFGQKFHIQLDPTTVPPVVYLRHRAFIVRSGQ